LEGLLSLFLVGKENFLLNRYLIVYLSGPELASEVTRVSSPPFRGRRGGRVSGLAYIFLIEDDTDYCRRGYFLISNVNQATA
jgi:hypothetical protein